MSKHNYDATLPQNLSIAMINLKDKNIIYSVQYLSNEDVQCDGDGYNSYWNITLFSVEKTKDDYIFHFNYSDTIHGYSYPYYKNISKFRLYSKKLSDLKNDFDTIFNKESKINIGHFISEWNYEYAHAFHSGDSILTSELKNLSVKMIEIEKEYEKQCEIDIEIAKKERKKYLQSEEYMKYLQEEKERKEKEEADYQKKEEERLKLCIEKYGEVLGREFHSRL
jgi:hypothetical protein